MHLRFQLVQPKALQVDLFGEGAQTIVGNIALAVRRRDKIHPINDALQRRILVGDAAQVRGQLLADLVGQLADDGQTGSSGFSGWSGM